MKPTSFEIALLKGEMAEIFIRSRLEAKGFVVYRPVTERAHAFDILAIKDKRRAIALDVKAKAAMNIAPITGVDETAHAVYAAFSAHHNMPFWIIFVDEQAQQIYGNTIQALDAPLERDGRQYPWVRDTRTGRIRFWHLDSMVKMGHVTAKLAEDLKALSQRSYKYRGATSCT